ncbi:hypothetical protein [Streptomyces sp. NPDC127098]|uniref:hypothetical protein n=1 Tax=Streptomyces sp. NPDC127098 TaxID=3347137 RepID=UPI003659A7DB
MDNKLTWLEKMGIARVGVLASAVIAAVSGCGGDPQAREYALPSDLCGTEVPSELYDGLFPNGSEVEIQESFSAPGPPLYECEVTVDGNGVIRSGTAAWDDFEAGIDNFGLPVEIEEGDPVSGTYDARVWPGAAIAQASCPELGSRGSFMVYIRAEHPEDEAESKSIMSELIQPYMAAVVDLIPEYGCES